MFLVWVKVILFHVKLVSSVHAFDLLLGPDSLVVISLKLGSRWCSPPQEVNADGCLTVVEELLLFSILLLQVVHIALIVIDGCDLFRKQVKCEVGKEKSFYKGQDASNERVGIILSTKKV